jgi:hypothetical protein
VPAQPFRCLGPKIAKSQRRLITLAVRAALGRARSFPIGLPKNTGWFSHGPILVLFAPPLAAGVFLAAPRPK